MKTCTIDGCDQPHRARGLCAHHWNQTYRKDQHREVPCTVCGKPATKNGPGTKRRTVCSDHCRYQLTFGHDIAEHRELIGPVERRPIQRRHPQPQSPPTTRFVAGSCDWCGQSYLHDLRVTGTVAKYCSALHSKAAWRARYRARRGQFSIPRTRRLAIYERDKWICQLCFEPVDPTLPATHRLSATLDHIECQSWALIPDHTDRNLRLAHLVCNSRRSDAA